MFRSITIIVVPIFGILSANLIAEEKPNQAAAQRKSAAAGNIDITRNVEYGKAGDRALLLDMYQPKNPNAEKLPVIVWIHGGGWRNGDKASGGRLIPFVASGNYVGISVGYRLSGEAIWPAQIHDCKAAIRWIRAHAKAHGIDAERIGVWGSSAGGHLVSLLGTSGKMKELEGNNGSAGVSSRVTCVVDYCGPTEMVIFKHPAVELLFGKPAEERKEEASVASPAAHVTKDDPPFLIVHGTKDSIVPISQAELFHERLSKAGVDVTFIKMQGGGHGIGGEEITQRVSTFFEIHLRGQDAAVSPEPVVVAPAQK